MDHGELKVEELTGWLNLLHSRLHVELDSLFLHTLHNSDPDLLAQNSLEGDLIHTHKSNTLRLLLQQSHRDFHSNEAGSDNHDISVLRHGARDRFGVFDETEGLHPFEVRSWDRDFFGFPAGREDEVVVFVTLAGGGRDNLARGVDFGDGLRIKSVLGLHKGV